MRWFLRSTVVLIFAWVVFFLSPYAALYNLAGAVQAQDTAVIQQRINLGAVRLSLSRQIASAYMKATGAEKQEGSLRGQLAVAAAASVIDPLIEPYLTPEAILDLLTRGAPRNVPESLAPGSLSTGLQISDLSFGRMKALFFASESRGFRGFVVRVPFEQPSETQYRLIFRLSGPAGAFTWRLVGLELPAKVRDQLVQQLVKV